MLHRMIFNMLKNLLLFIWQLPQNILAFIYRLVIRSAKLCFITTDNIKIYCWNLHVGVSLGSYIFVPYKASYSMVAHEYGHTRQSIVLGPLYLVLIGLPSALWLTAYGILRLHKRGISYKAFFIEKMADKLGRNVKLLKA